MRENARLAVEAAKEGWWGLGGEKELEEEEERRRRIGLMEVGSEAWRLKRENEKIEGREVVKMEFGKGKVSLSWAGGNETRSVADAVGLGLVIRSRF